MQTGSYGGGLIRAMKRSGRNTALAGEMWLGEWRIQDP